MFSPTDKKIYDVRAMAGIPDGYFPQTVVSPDGKYVWMGNGVTSYLINLMTFEAVKYETGYVNDFTWSPNSQFAWFNSSGSGKNALEYDLISVSDQELKLFYTSEIQPRLEWHPSGNRFAGILDQSLFVSDVPDLAVREIATPTVFLDLSWSPNGDRIAFLAKDGSVWQIDYPALQNWEQLTPSLPHEYYLTYGMSWSPDGNSIAFVGGSDIYIVDTIK
jgi:WD40 repeat protein